MKIAIMQPYIFPYIGYFQLVHAVDTFVILDDVNYINKGWINRNNILVNQSAYLFTIPLEEASQNKRINEIYVADKMKWRTNFLRTIEQSYKKAPFYHQVFPLIQDIINSDNPQISSLNHYALLKLGEYIGLDTKIISSSSKYDNRDLKAQSRIIDICLKEKASTYINPIGGTELYDRQTFADKNLELYFLKTGAIAYPQFNLDFIPGLSIIDVMMFNDIETIQDYLNRYELL